MHRLPFDILQQILALIPFPTRWEAARVSRLWYQVCNDHLLYTHIHLENMELEQLVHVLGWIQRLKPNIRSLTIRQCHSVMLQQRLPVQSSSTMPTSSHPAMYTQLRSLNVDRRRAFYMQQECQWYQHLNASLATLLRGSTRLTNITLENNDIDWAIIGIADEFCSRRVGATLQAWTFQHNFGNVIETPAQLLAFMAATPHLRHFLGHHPHAINDAVLIGAIDRWPLLKSAMIACAINLGGDDDDDNSDDHRLVLVKGGADVDAQATADAARSAVSASAFYKWLLACAHHLESLHLIDLHCVSDKQLAYLAPNWLAMHHTHQLSHGATKRPKAPALRHLRIAKYVTDPVTHIAIDALATMFPLLQSVAYDTNATCFRLTRNMPQDHVVHLWHAMHYHHHHATNHAHLQLNWTMPDTMDQHLLACQQLMASQHAATPLPLTL
ncbi:hypothetical protein BC940DRAFT_287162 [Gongronella butleri]|nr:hypothetical protein BC940DRAFT_287162 [Gongronella butleri]